MSVYHELFFRFFADTAASEWRRELDARGALCEGAGISSGGGGFSTGELTDERENNRSWSSMALGFFGLLPDFDL